MSPTERKATQLVQLAVATSRQEKGRPMYAILSECAQYLHCSQTVFTAAAVLLGIQKN